MAGGEASTSYEQSKYANDMALWKKSTAYYDIICFVKTINRAVQGKKLSTKLNPSKIGASLLHIFDALNKMIDEKPPTFGNWFEKMKSTSTDSLQKALPRIFHDVLTEISTYFIESFGNATQHGIEYGTEHELAFIMFLCSLFKIHVLTKSDKIYVGLKIFNAYLQFVRRLQSTYSMKPAGSHGVSGMDDNQYVPFIWGSAQLSVKKPFKPNRILETDVIKRYKNEYYFIGYIDHIGQVKPDSFVDQLLTLDSWEQMNTILINQFKKELLAKFPVIQHLLSGSILTLMEIDVVDALRYHTIIINNELYHFSNPTTVWDTIISQFDSWNQLVWFLSLVGSGLFSDHTVLILGCSWLFWIVWLIFRLFYRGWKNFNRPTPPPTP